MGLLRWLMGLTKNTRAARARIEQTASGLADDMEAIRARFRQQAGLEPLPMLPAVDAAADGGEATNRLNGVGKGKAKK